MCAFRSNYSNHVEFVLSSDLFKPIVLTQEPEGWDEDGLEYSRHDDYHGIFFSFTNDLTFYKEAKDFIEETYNRLGVNAVLTLTKKMLINNDDDDLVLTSVYVAYADFKTMNFVDDGLKIKFNSNNLAEVLKSHESDKFEIERLTSIDNVTIPKFKKGNISIQGRSLQLVAESNITNVPNGAFVNLPLLGSIVNNIYSKRNWLYNSPSVNPRIFAMTPITKIISEGIPRFSSVDYPFFEIHGFTPSPSNTLTASNLFYTNTTDNLQTTRSLTVNYNLRVVFSMDPIVTAAIGTNLTASINFYKVRFNNQTGDYDVIETVELNNFTGTSVRREVGHTYVWSSVIGEFNEVGEINFELEYNEGVACTFNFSGDAKAAFYNWDLKVNEVADIAPSNNLSFTFVHDTWSRIMQIITGRDNAFYSKYFGRKELGYKEDGEGGLIGLISGFWVRAFDPDSDKYKSLTTSHVETLESMDAVFNVGLGIEVVGFEERIRVEPVEYFYREETVIKLTGQIYDYKRKITPNDFYSGLEFGYRRGGDYEDEQGLDEPNTRSSSVTPIRKSNKKYKKLARFRSDEYGLERLRRKPQLNFPDEDTRGDSDIWLLDVKRGSVDGSFDQKIWSDRLSELPSGIFSPPTYKSAFFTPLRMLFRHAKTFMDGIEPYRDRLITYANGVANVVLKTKFIGENKAYQENEDIPVADLDRALFKPEEVTFKHAYSDDLFNLINGKTKTIVGGEVEEVSNLLFAMSFIDRVGKIESGYITNIKITEDIEFTVRLANLELNN